MLLAPAASDDLVGEVADLWFHSMVLLARDGLDPLAPLQVLAARHRPALGCSRRLQEAARVLSWSIRRRVASATPRASANSTPMRMRGPAGRCR